MKKYQFIKRTLILLLAGVYFFAVNGLAIQKIFCCGKLERAIFSLTANGRCSECPANKNCEDGCCDSKIVFQKLNDSQKTSATVKVNQPKMITLFNFTPQYLLVSNENNSQKNYSAFVSPPLIPCEPVFLVNRCILI